MTAEVETTDGTKTDSSVFWVGERDADGWWAFPETRGVSSCYKGQAVVGDVKLGKCLFELLYGKESSRYAKKITQSLFMREIGSALRSLKTNCGLIKWEVCSFKFTFSRSKKDGLCSPDSLLATSHQNTVPT